MGYIYMLTSPSGKSYIGQTVRTIEKRLEEHETGKSIGCRAIYNAIKKYGWENFEKDWYECPDEDLNSEEKLLVRDMGTLSPDGYNLMDGGGSRGKPSDETKQKMSESMTGDKHPMFGKPKSEETKQKMSEAQLGKTPSDEARQKMSEAQRGEKHRNFGKTHSEETKRKMSDSVKGQKNHKSKRVYQYDLDGTLLGSFGSSGEAALHLKKDDGTSIRRCARGKRNYNTAHGFKWSYENSM
jgi:hypothetical protein